MFQEKKIELKKNLIEELEDKKKNIESERNSMDLTGGRLYVKKNPTHLGYIFHVRRLELHLKHCVLHNYKL